MGAGTSKLNSDDLKIINDIINNYNKYSENIKKVLNEPLKEFKKILKAHEEQKPKLESESTPASSSVPASVPASSPKSAPSSAPPSESPSASSAPSGPSAPTASKQNLETQPKGGRSRKKKGKKKKSRKK